jgi:hypothetical protein
MPSVPWVRVGWVLGLLVLAYLPILIRRASQWTNDDDMGHGFFVPAIAGYIAWQRRGELAELEVQPNWLGLLVMMWAMVQMMLGILGAELFLQRSAFVCLCREVRWSCFKSDPQKTVARRPTSRDFAQVTRF